MKTGSQVSKHKREKLNEKDGTHRHQYHKSLNDFPDAILCHILSFLPTESAVGTSVLSTRWRYMWTSLPSLDFKERIHPLGRRNEDKRIERKNLIDFVERILCRKNSPRIQKFSLLCNVEDDASRINTWISTAVIRKAREFDIFLGYIRADEDDQNVLPQCLFNCEALEVLKIYTSLALLLPSQIRLPNLKKLTLKGVTLKDYHELNLLFASSTLEDLVINGCVLEGDAIGHLIISAPKLRSLTIKESDAVYLTNHDHFASVMISSPLTTFHYSGAFNGDYRLSCSPSIERATLLLDSFTDEDLDLCVDHFHKVVTSLQFVEYLGLSGYAINCLSCGGVPTFKNLNSLEVFDDAHEDTNEGLEMFLIKCPLLETLKIEGLALQDCDTTSLLSLELLCLSSLKNITIEFCEGTIEKLIAVHILLAKTTSLETMEIVFPGSEWMDVSERKKIKKFVSAIPRGSKSCKLYFKRLL